MDLKRKHIRFSPDDQMTVVYIDLVEGGDEFNPTIVAIPYSESYGGCGVILRHTEKIKEGVYVKVKLGNLAPISARTAWCENIDSYLTKVGLEFLD